MTPGEEYVPPAGGDQNQEDCADNPYAPGCQPPTDGEEYAPPAGGETPPGYEPTPPPTDGEEYAPPAGGETPPGYEQVHRLLKKCTSWLKPPPGEPPPAEDPPPPS